MAWAPDDIVAAGKGAAYGLVVAAAAVEAIPAVGLLVPGGLFIGAAAALGARGLLELEWVFAAAMLGSVLGDLAGYIMGRRWGWRFVARLPFGSRILPPARLATLEERIRRHAFLTVAAGRFQLPIRSLVPFLAGAARVPVLGFLLPNLGAALVAIGTLVGVGVLLEYGYDEASRALGASVIGVVLGATALYVVYLVRSTRKTKAMLRGPEPTPLEVDPAPLLPRPPGK